jgi:hypothetical protein
VTLCVFNGSQCSCQPDEGTPCPYLPRYRWCEQLDVMEGPVPDGAWVRWSDVQRVILDPIKRVALAERNAGVSTIDCEPK